MTSTEGRAKRGLFNVFAKVIGSGQKDSFGQDRKVDWVRVGRLIRSGQVG